MNGGNAFGWVNSKQVFVTMFNGSMRLRAFVVVSVHGVFQYGKNVANNQFQMTES